MHRIPLLKIKVLVFIRLTLASHIVPQIRYLGFTLEGRRVPWLRRRSCPLASPLENKYTPSIGWSKVSRCKKKNQKKTENYTKSHKRSNIDHLFPGNGARKRGLLMVYIRLKLQLDLQVDKSSVVVKVSNPWNNMRCKNQSNKAKNFDLRKVKPMHLILKIIMKTNLIYGNRW
jgi:hypothetical protein